MTLSQQDLNSELSAYIDSRPKVSTHCHQLPQRELEAFDLEALLRNSYVNWCGVAWDNSNRAHEILLEKVAFNSFFVWLQKSLQELYGESSRLTAGNWQNWNERIQSAYQNRRHAREVLSLRCGYRRMLLDAYWDPGSNNDSAELYAPVYRVNAFFFGYSASATDHDGNNPYRLSRHAFMTDLGEYTGWVREAIRSKQAGGCVALKIPIAYDRGLDFNPVSDEMAQQAFTRLTAGPAGQMAGQDETERKLPSNAPGTGAARQDGSSDPLDVKTFQDYLFFQICQMAAELDLPIQIHTGMGQGQRTNAAQLQTAIRNNPETRFVLLHCSYPWIQDICMLVDKYPNVFPDLSMLPLISTQSAKAMLHELIERATLDRIFWGCDTWTAEESFGALLAFRQVLATTLAEKVREGYFSSAEACLIVDAILLKNPERFYKLAAAG